MCPAKTLSFPNLLILSFLLLTRWGLGQGALPPVPPTMYYADSVNLGRPFAKDPSVVKFHGKYFMYYSVPPKPSATKSGEELGWGIGIARSSDRVHWTRITEMKASQEVASHGIAAPGARVIRNQVHLFYQTYGRGALDSICHATSSDGVHFVEDASNPVYRPTEMPWSVGRAIDAEVFLDPPSHKAYLFFATRDPSMHTQMLGLAAADIDSDFSKGTWHDVSKAEPLLKPELPWEQICIEAPTVVKHGSHFYLFYAGAYNNAPQQIGVAVSDDLVHWKRISELPFFPNGAPGTWNSSESGHPGVLQDGDKTYLYYQGNNDHGKTYYLSMIEVIWKGDVPMPAHP